MTAFQPQPYLSALTDAELRPWLAARNLPSYRGAQILDWIYKKWHCDPDAMPNLPPALRARLKNDFICHSSAVAETVADAEQVVKLLIRLRDREKIETVIIPAGGRHTFCLSTQVGCPVRCRFCASGRSGLIRNLAAGEILEQFFHACRHLGRLPDNVVFMGIGEGLLNFRNLADTLQLLTAPDKIGLGQRRITVSTSGWAPGVRQLAEMRQAWNLAISLHAPDDETRARLIPEKFRRPIGEIMDAAIYYRQLAGRMITFEYTLLAAINDRPDQAIELAKLAKKVRAKVNIIPYNPGGASGFDRPADARIQRFVAVLKDHHVQVTCRSEKGASIRAACGQLRAESAPLQPDNAGVKPIS